MNNDKLHYFFPKVMNRLAVEKNLLWKYFNVERFSMNGFNGFRNASSLKTQLRLMLGEYDINMLSDISENDKLSIIDDAEKTLRHEFDLLGSGPVRVDPIDWHLDFRIGARWDKRFYRELCTPKGADLKMPWELSRCQHLLWLGESWLLTAESKYAQEVMDEINWWIDDNLLMYSVNWKCAMDVAFRAVNWMFALNMISEYQGFDDEFCAKVEKSLWQHGFFIKNNLERQIPYSNNHYASDIVGLLYIGALFNHFSKAKRWYRFALKEYYQEVLTQVFPSGVHYERSVSYHRMMTELFSYPVYMLKRVKEEVPHDVMERIGKMYEYVASYTKPNGLAPLIADNDDGRFVPFMRRDFRRHNYLNDSDSIENRFVSSGMPPLFCTSLNGSKSYSDAGVAIFKQENNYLYVNHGGYSKYPKDSDVLIGSHTHNDLLSFELSLNGEDILVDAGTYLYTSSKEDRDAFRSTAKHNTIVVDDEEQNGFPGSFELKRNVQKSKLSLSSDGVIEGDYTTLGGQMYHKRYFDFKGKELVITDTIKKNGSGHRVKLFFHFADGISAEIKDNSIVTDNNILFFFDVVPNKVDVTNDTISPSYGVLVKTKTGVVTYSFETQIVIKTTIKRLK